MKPTQENRYMRITGINGECRTGVRVIDEEAMRYVVTKNVGGVLLIKGRAQVSQGPCGRYRVCLWDRKEIGFSSDSYPLPPNPNQIADSTIELVRRAGLERKLY